MALRKSHLYASLWQSCDQLRGGMDASQYKDYVLTLVFMKYVSDKYAGTDDLFPDITVPQGGSFADMVALKGSKEIGDGINVVIRRLADVNDFLLKGVIDQADFNDESKLGRGQEMTDRLTKLIGIFEQLDFRANRAQGDDLLGDAYEYLMRHFATQSGKSKGQFYTPAEVSRIMAQVIGIGLDTTRDLTVYDPTCGSGSLLIKAADEAPKGLTIYGQEMDVATWTMARMNMILHGQTTAEVKHGNTLAAPSFTEGPGQLRRFDFAVANPPFSTKAWSNGLDPAHDEFRRFDYGIPPRKNGDYAFLLHLVASLKSTGKGAIILPHGILFRGNREADIRRELVRHRLIRGIIGLPANLFYGTGIPACIVVIDKENTTTRDGIFMVDASKGFRKDGAKNRLRERDIHRIVDVFNEQKESPGYARMVPLTEIANTTNDYNLNIPRYIDSSEPEDLHDLGAHLHGGIPNRDIDALGCFWEVFPGLRQRLFAPSCREGYSEVHTKAEEVRAVILEHEEFSIYREQIRGVFTGWQREHSFQLHGLGAGDSPKTLIRDLSEDLLRHFDDLPLLDRYDVYQRLMDYWDEVMQDDVYLVVAEGWAAGRQVREADRSEEPDFWLKKGRRMIKYVGVLVPAFLVIERFFAKEKALADSIEASLMVVVERKSEFEEEHSGDDGALSDLEGQKGITKGNVQEQVVALKNVILQTYNRDTSEYERAKKIGKTTFGDHAWETGTVDPEGLFTDLDVLHEWLQLANRETNLRRKHNGVIDDLYAKVEAKYGELTKEEIRTLVVDDKWMVSVENAIRQQVEHLTGGLMDRVKVLETRYAKALPELSEKVEELEARVKLHQQLLTGRTRLPGFDGEWKWCRLGDLGKFSKGRGIKRDELRETGVRCIRYGELYTKYENYVVTPDSRIPNDVALTALPIKKGDLLFAGSGETAEEIGTCVAYLGNEPAFAGGDIIVLRAPGQDAVYLAHLLNAPVAACQKARMAQGDAVVHIRGDHLAAIELRIPPLPEQRAIASVLFDMDTEIALLERSLEKTRAIKQGMMQQLLTGSIRLPIPDGHMEDDDAHDA